ncbi:MAG: EAL domain-containing protein, partial [Actinobacteria bacterium]|nr:EAL domain-containing protein [Actinomycetota bacterium]
MPLPRQRLSAPHGFWERVALLGPEPLFVLDPDGVCLVVSDAAVTETGFSPNEIVGRPFHVLSENSEQSSVQRRIELLSPVGHEEFGMTISTAHGELHDVRVLARRDELEGDPVVVATLQRASIARSAERLLRRKAVLEHLIERVQQQAAHATPSDVPEIIGWVLAEATTFLGADRGYLLSYDAAVTKETMTHEWVAPGIESEKESFVDIPLAMAPASSQCHRDLEVFAIRDVSALGSGWAADQAFYESLGLQSILELPIVLEGVPVGCLGFEWITRHGDWADADLILLRVIAATVGQLIGREAAEHEMQRRSMHDELTGLLNRNGLLDGLCAGAETCVGSIIVIDLDGFNALNDSLGRSAGDLLLRTVAARLRGLVRPGDLVARIGSDEFAIAMRAIEEEWVVGQAARRICDALAEPFTIDGRQHLVTVSCGISTSAGAEAGAAVDADELIRQAGAAMFRARGLGQANVAMFDPTHERVVAERFELEQRLRMALDRAEFEVHFQPEVDVLDGRVVGAEALLRWRCDGVLQDAGAFVPLTEETGLIIPIGRWVLSEAVHHGQRWAQWLGLDEFVVRVNVSPRQFEDVTFIDHVESTLRRAGLPPHCLCLEITETALMHDAEAAIAILHRLDALGIQLAIDDFGTGYSSLAYLKQFPVDILKIDRSFVMTLADDPQDRAIVQTVINLAQSLGMDVTAEGIETVEQAEVLNELGCRRGQGWLYSKAIEPEALDEMIWAALAVVD